MSWNYYGFRPYLPVAERRAKAARELAKLAKKNGQASSPVLLDGSKIASTFWGKAWCDNLEAYSDYANRLPRGRSYVRNGSVVHLEVSQGKVTARVSGSSLYKIEIKIKPLAPSLWKSIQSECAGKIDSLIELLQGKLSSSVMQIVTRPERGLFPTPKEIELDCSCPDWADLCKHVAASLYGVGARLDQSPELLFLLRGVDPADLISQASAAETVRQSARAEGAAAMSEAEIADVFGIELADTPTPVQSTGKSHKSVDAKNQTPIPVSIQEPKTKPPKKASRRISSSARAKIAAAARARWDKIKAAADRDKPSVRKMSAAARAKIVAAQKARWARHKTTLGE
ncbi:MAG: SWIM zinc finger family protein [Limisphaerales bacterium]